MATKFVQKLRKSHQLSQEFMAKSLEISRPTYAQIEQGERELTISEARKLSDIFNLSLDDFLNERVPVISSKIKKKKLSTSKKGVEIRISIPQESIEKFKQVLLYLLKKVGGKPNIAETAIYKLLYFIDFDYYEIHETQLMGLRYLRNHFGPTPVLFKRIIDDMIKSKEIERIKSAFYQYPQTKYLINPMIEPNLSVLNGQELEHIDWELTRLSDMTAAQLSEFSHKDIPWLYTPAGKLIEYEAVFYRTSATSVRKEEEIQ